MLKLSLIALFITSMATLTIAASSMPVPDGPGTQDEFPRLQLADRR